jgi:hypothetical protein
MTFDKIGESSTVAAGEYILYIPHDRIVMCGDFNRECDYIRAWGGGKYIEDKIETFRKISLSNGDAEGLRQKRSRCKACGG